MPGRQTMPGTLRRSPARAQRTWIKAHDNAVREYGEGERAHRTAYAALKHSFEKVGDRWSPKERRGPSDPRAPRGERGTARERRDVRRARLLRQHARRTLPTRRTAGDLRPLAHEKERTRARDRAQAIELQRGLRRAARMPNASAAASADRPGKKCRRPHGLPSSHWRFARRRRWKRCRPGVFRESPPASGGPARRPC